MLNRMIIILGVACSAFLIQGAEDPPKWPSIGSLFPADEAEARTKIAPDRLGIHFWKNPPEVISPYERSWYDFQTIIWGGQSGALAGKNEYFDALRSLYFRGSMVYSQGEPIVSTKGRMGFYNTCITNKLYIRNKPGAKIRAPWKKDPGNHKNSIRIPSLEDPATDQAERQNAFKAAQRNAPHVPFAYDLRDEATYTLSSASPHDFDFSEVSLAAFRVWLKTRYETIENLNREWDTHFKEWRAVVPLTSAEIMSREFPRLPEMNLAPWANHREYNEDTFISAIARYRDEIHRKDPGAPVGISGTQMPSAWGGFNFYKLGLATSWIEHYDVCGSHELIRSFMSSRKLPSIKALRYRDGVVKGLRNMWYYTLHGDAGALIWPFKGNAQKNVIFEVTDGKIKPTKIGEDLGAIFKETRSGIPCLLRRAEFQTDPIGVLVSAASLRADWVLEVKRDGKDWVNRFSSWESSHNFAAAGRQGMYKMLEDIGLQYRCFSSKEVERGALLKQGLKLFIMPRGMALSKKEIEELKKFVEKGGVLVSDVMAGRMNENGRVWPGGSSPLDEVLGVKRGPFAFTDESGKAEVDGGTYTGGFGHDLNLKMKTDFQGLKAGETFTHRGHYEPGLKVASGRALAETNQGPALIENTVGKGFAYTLNFDMPNYLKKRAQKDVEQATLMHRRLLAALVQKAGIQSPVRLTRKGETNHPVGLETFRYKLGAAGLYAAHINGSVRIEWSDLSDKGEGVADVGQGKLLFKLPKKGYVSEVRSRKTFGLTDTVEVTMQKDRPVILAVLPYQVKALKVDLGKGRIENNRLALSVNVDAEGSVADHVIHAELMDSSGKTVPESVVNLPLAGGRYKGAIDMSYVPGKGPWTLRLKDVASGVQAEHKVTR